MQRTQSHILILIAISALVLFTNLGKARLWDRDEPRNAGCAVEMMERGNLVVPMFNDELRPQKPALLYWLIISAYKVFGVTEFAARFWSAVLGIGSVIATYFIGRRLFDSNVALAGSIALSTSMMFVVAGRAATPDSVLIFFSTLAMLFYVLGTFAPRASEADAPSLHWPGYFFPQKLGYVIAMYACMGVGVLAKGPVGFVLPCAIIGMFMLIQRLPQSDNETWNSRGWLARLSAAIVRPFHPVHFWKTLWAMRPITLAIVVLAVAAPWYVAVGLQTNWDWPKQFLLTENLARATSTFESHRGNIFYYPLAIILGFFPWSVFLGPTLLGVDKQITRKHHWSMSYTFLLCWVGVQVGIFSLAQTKLPSYITPCYPAIALLTGTFLVQLASQKTTTTAKFNQWSLITLVVSGVLITAGLMVTSNLFLNGDMRVVLVGLIPIIGGGFAIWYFTQEKSTQAVHTCYGTAIAFVVTFFGFGTSFVDSHQQSEQILGHVAASGEQANKTPLATFGCLESSWVYYAGQPIYELTREARKEPWSDDREHPWLKKDWPSPEQFVAAHPDALLITTERDLEELKARLPDNYVEIERADYFLKNRDLILLGPGNDSQSERVADSNSDDVR